MGAPACLAGLAGLALTGFAGVRPRVLPILELAVFVTGVLLVGLRVPIPGRLRARCG